MLGDQGLRLNGIGLRAYLVGFPFFASGRVVSASVRIEVLVQDPGQQRQTFEALMLFEGQRKPCFPRLQCTEKGLFLQPCMPSMLAWAFKGDPCSKPLGLNFTLFPGKFRLEVQNFCWSVQV